MKFVRIILLTLVLLIVIAVVSIGSLVLFINPNKLKPLITQQIEKKTGYVATIHGKLSWSFYPRFSVYVPDLILTKPPETTPFVHFSQVKLGASLINLLFNADQFEGTINIANMQFLNVHAEQGYIEARWQHRMLVLKTITAHLYGGQLSGVANMQLFGSVPHWKWDMTLTHIALAAFLQDLYHPDKALLDGTAQVRFQGISQGSTQTDILTHLNGVTVLSVDHGALLAANDANAMINALIQRGQQLFSNQTPSSMHPLSLTLFDQLTGSALIDHGIATCNNLLINAPSYVMTGTGTLNLLNNALNMALQIKAPLSQQSSDQPFELSATLTGTMDHPIINVDTATLSKTLLKQDVIKQRIDKAKTKLRETIKKHLSGDVGKMLGQLLGT